MAGQNINRRVHTDTILKNPLDLDLEQGTNKGALAQVDAESSSMMSNKTAGPTHTSATPTPANSPFIPSQPCSESTATSFGTWSPRHLHQKRILMILIVFLGATASSAFLWIGIKGAMDEAEKRFTTDALDLTNAIKAAWDDYEIFALWIHESCHLRHPTGNSTPEEDISTYARFCSRDKFQHLYDYINSVGLEFVAIQYIPNITNAERPYVEDESKLFHHQRNPNMTYMGIKALDLSPTDGSVVSLGPSPVKAWYFPMHYLLPLEKNENAVDIDLYSYRQKEIEKAFETRMPVLGNRARLFQDPDPRVYGIEFIHPGIHNYSDVKKEEERTGLSKLVIKIPALVNRAAAAFLKDSRVYLFDASNPDEEPVFLAGADLVGNKIDLKEVCLCSEVPSASKTFSKTICIMDKQWRIVIQPLGNNYEEQLRFVILGGVLIFLACVIIVFWFRTHMNRLAKESRIKSKAESEKSELALSQVKRERHLNDFIAHEVRNPLTSAMAALSFVSTTTQKRITDAEIRKALLDDISIVSGSLEYINDLLKNMLDIHKTACNEMRLDIDSVNILEEIFEPVAKILVPRFGTVQTIIDCPPNLFAEIDRLRMKQVILNLAINASKFVDEGFIRLRAETIEEHTCIIVEDSGPGIPEHKRHQLFEKFQQSLDLNNQGTGIGLYVCKNLVGLMGGFIYLDESYRSEHLICPGSRFVIDLNQSPVYKPPSSCNGLVHGGHDSHGTEDDGHFSHSSIPSLVDQPMTMKHVLPLPEELTVLFVDDDAILRKLFARSIARVRPKWHIDHASHGEEALEMVETKKYELIFIDQYMASDKKKMLLGTETVPLMRRQAKKATCIICGLSANDLKDQFLDAGADAFMLKPFPCEKKALEQELIRVWGQGQEENVESSVAYVA